MNDFESALAQAFDLHTTEAHAIAWAIEIVDQGESE